MSANQSIWFLEKGGGSYEIERIDVDILSAEEIEKRSVCKVTDPKLYDRNIPRPNSVDDTVMGSMNSRILCGTCQLPMRQCCGHEGHIPLPFPVYNISYKPIVLKILRMFCYYCSSCFLDWNDSKVKSIINSSKGLDRLNKLSALCSKKSKKKATSSGGVFGVCPNPDCKAEKPNYKTTHPLKIDIDWTGIEDRSPEEKKKQEKPFTALEALLILQGISNEDYQKLGLVPSDFEKRYNKIKTPRPEDMIWTNFVVPPPCIRPAIMESSGSKSKGQDDLTRKLIDIVKGCNKILEWMKDNNVPSFYEVDFDFYNASLIKLVDDLQLQCTMYVNNEIKGVKKSTQRSGAHDKGIVQRLSSKEGRMREDVLGKRVDFCARAVVTCDPFIPPNYIGIPHYIALTLTYPCCVNQWNREKMKKHVLTGFKKLGGAESIIDLQGNIISLEFCTEEQRKNIKIEDRMIVNRYMQDGDVMIVNRQPTLHRASMMGHLVKLLPFHTIRLNESDCTPYNADFDGDEMNLHLPQTETARADILNLMYMPNQIRSAQNNKPQIALVQDSIIAAFLMTSKDVLFTKEESFQLLSQVSYPVGDHFYELPTPCILKNGPQGKPLWSGKQIFSKLIDPLINLKKGVRDFKLAKSKSTPEKPFDELLDAQERYVWIKNGEILMGRLCKATIGRDSGSIIDLMILDLKKSYEKTCEFIHNAQRMLRWFVDHHGVTISMSDCVASHDIRKKIDSAIKKATITMQEVKNMNRIGISDEDIEKYNIKIANSILDYTDGILQEQISYKNNTIYALPYVGSKGSMLNPSQIICAIGQQSNEGKRLGILESRSLPQFEHGDQSAEGKGFVSSCYYKGLQPYEFFFHTMGGREGLVDTAVKTASTGYVQRRLEKSMESNKVEYDRSVRNSNGEVIEFIYGGDGFDPEFQETVFIPLLEWSNEKLVQVFSFSPDEITCLQLSEFDLICLNDYIQQVSYLKQKAQIHRCGLLGGVLEPRSHLNLNVERLVQKVVSSSYNKKICPDLKVYYVIQALSDMLNRMESIIGKFGSTLFTQLHIHHWLHPKNMICLLKATRQEFDSLIQEVENRFVKNLISPGEAVGHLAGQSLGEPITQMSVHFDETLFYQKNGKCEYNKIGYLFNSLNQMNLKKHHLTDTDTTIIDCSSLNMFIPAVNEDGNVNWRKITAATRHPPNGKLVSIRTLSGRTVKATLAKSFLTRKDNKVVPVNGNELKVGDVLPVTGNLELKTKLLVDYKYRTWNLDDELGYFLGLFGSRGKIENGNKIHFSNIYEYQILKLQQFTTKYKLDHKIIYEKDCFQHAQFIIYSKFWSKFLTHFGDIPNFVFFAPHTFVLSFLNGLIYGQEMVWQKQYAEKISILLMRLQVLCSMEDDIDNCIKLTIPNLKCNKDESFADCYSDLVYSLNNDIYWDPIIELNYIDCDQDYVYDLTVEKDLNFMLANGLQMRDTLNTFHFAGVSKKNVTLGIPRVDELINVSNNIKKSCITLYLKSPFNKSEKSAMHVVQNLECTMLSQFVKHSSVEHISQSFSELENQLIQNVRWYHQYELQSPNYSSYMIRLVLNKAQLLSSGMGIDQVVKRMKDYMGETAYITSTCHNHPSWIIHVYIYNVDKMMAPLSNSGSDEPPQKKQKLNHSESCPSTEADKQEWMALERNLIAHIQNHILNSILLRGIQEIQKCNVEKIEYSKFEPETGMVKKMEEYVLYVSYKNERTYILEQLMSLNVVDRRRSYTNNIMETFDIHGIEPTNQMIYHELKTVMSFDGTYINDRHLQMVANTNTHTGNPSGMNRQGMKKAQTGFLQRGSFEVTVDVFTKAALCNESDKIHGATENVMVGQRSRMGTGCIDVFTDTVAIQNHFSSRRPSVNRSQLSSQAWNNKIVKTMVVESKKRKYEQSNPDSQNMFEMALSHSLPSFDQQQLENVFDWNEKEMEQVYRPTSPTQEIKNMFIRKK